MPKDSVALLVERVEELKKALGGLPWSDDHVEAMVKLVRLTPLLAEIVKWCSTRLDTGDGAIGTVYEEELEDLAAAALKEIGDG